MKHIELRLPSNPVFMKIVRCAMQHLCELCEFTPDLRHSITLAVDEAIANIIRHAYPGQEDQPVYLRCEILPDQLEIVLRDHGTPVDPAKIKSRDLTDVRPGGLGVHLIKSVMDVVEYSYTPEEGNILKLAKFLPEGKQGNG